jgi:hypothetical protein
VNTKDKTINSSMTRTSENDKKRKLSGADRKLKTLENVSIKLINKQLLPTKNGNVPGISTSIPLS